jgi:hypothetical protein
MPKRGARLMLQAAKRAGAASTSLHDRSCNRWAGCYRAEVVAPFVRQGAPVGVASPEAIYGQDVVAGSRGRVPASAVDTGCLRGRESW